MIANGDIDSPQKAKVVMDFTNADAMMIGRIAQQRPWIFEHIHHYLVTGKSLQEPDDRQKQKWLRDHLNNLYAFYGEFHGVQIAA